jgi:VWFA-related protein
MKENWNYQGRNEECMMRKIILLVIFSIWAISHPYLYTDEHKPIPYQVEQRTLQHEVSVTLKLVQVYVTDKKGNPITDLDKSEFEIFDNEVLMDITEFETYSFSSAQSEEVKKEIAESSSETMNRKFFLFFDFAFNNPTGIKASKDAAIHFLENKLQPTDKVGILSYSSFKGLKLHEYLTTDHSKVREVIDGFGVRKVLGRVEDVEEKYFRTVSGMTTSDASQDAQDLDASFQAQQPGMPASSNFTGRYNEAEILEYKYHAINFCTRLEDMAKAFRYIPGHKHIVLFSSGVASSIMYGIGSPLGSLKTGSLGDEETRTSYENMIKELSSSNTQVYALNTEEQRARIHQDEEMLGGLSLRKIAKSTGGKYFDKVQKYETALDEIQNITSTYYVLGYYVDEKWDGKYHELKVRVKRKGTRVHTQAGYYNPKLFSEYTKLEKQIHLVDLALTDRPYLQTPLYFPMVTLPCPIVGGNLFTCSKIPVDRIKEISGEKTEIVYIVFDEREDIIDFKRMEINFSKLSNKNIYYYVVSNLPPGLYQCRVVIRNLETGRGAKAASQAIIQEKQDSKFKLWPPLLLKPEQNVIFLNNPPRIYPFDKNQYSPLLEDLSRGTSKLLLVLPCSADGIEDPRFSLWARLIVQTTGEEIRPSFSVVDSFQEQDMFIFVVEIQTQDLEAGKYSLYVFLDEKDQKLRSHTITNITIK